MNASVNIAIHLNTQSVVNIDLIDITGRLVTICNDKSKVSNFNKQINTSNLATGTYTMRINVDGKLINRSINVLH